MGNGIGPLLPRERDQFMQGAHVAVLGTNAKSGPPHLTPVWYDWDGRNVRLALAEGSTKTYNLDRYGEFSLCVDKRDWPYMSIIAQCRVTGHSTREGYPQNIAQRYLEGGTLTSFLAANKSIVWRIVDGAPYAWAGHINRSGG